MSEPNYKVIELEAENERLKDELIILLKEKIEELQKQVIYLESLIRPVERDAGSNMIAPPNFKQKPMVKTTSELATILERRSIKAGQVAEEVNE